MDEFRASPLRGSANSKNYLIVLAMAGYQHWDELRAETHWAEMHWTVTHWADMHWTVTLVAMRNGQQTGCD